MRVCLVTPPSPYLINDKSLPWLGPLWVAACLRERGHEVSVLDLAGNPDYLQFAAMHAQSVGADVYGLTATAPDYPLAVQIRDAIRSVNPQQRIILGGAHASMAEVVGPGWDCTVRGDGFHTAERALSEVGTIFAYRRGEILEDVDALPLPARDLIDVTSYDFRVVGERATSIFTIWGCAQGCTFCSGRDIFAYRKMRWMSPHRVLYELDAIRDNYGFTAFSDFADEWNLNRQKLLDRCAAIAAHHWHPILRCFCKAEHLDDEAAGAMARAGVVEVLVGVESGSDRILKLIKKNTSWEINGAARLAAKRNGLRFKAATMIGLPSETREDIQKTKEWLLTFKPDAFDCTVFSPMPGSPIYDHPEKYAVGLQIENGDGTFVPYKTFPGNYRSKVRTDTLSAEDLVVLRDEIDRDVRQALSLESPGRNDLHDSSMGQSSGHLVAGLPASPAILYG